MRRCEMRRESRAASTRTTGAQSRIIRARTDVMGIRHARTRSRIHANTVHSHRSCLWARDDRVTTPLDLASQMKRKEVVALLKQAGGKHAFELDLE